MLTIFTSDPIFEIDSIIDVVIHAYTIIIIIRKHKITQLNHSFSLKTSNTDLASLMPATWMAALWEMAT